MTPVSIAEHLETFARRIFILIDDHSPVGEARSPSHPIWIKNARELFDIYVQDHQPSLMTMLGQAQRYTALDPRSLAAMTSIVSAYEVPLAARFAFSVAAALRQAHGLTAASAGVPDRTWLSWLMTD